MARIFDEKFEGAGYEESWTESVAAGCTIDEDADTADVSNPANWESQCCKIINAGSNAAFAYSQIGDGAIRYTRIEVIFTDLASINDHGDKCHFAGSTSNGLDAWAWALAAANQSGTKKIRFEAYEDGTVSVCYSNNVIAEDTLYRIEVKWDSIANTWEWKINGVSQDSGSLTAGHTEMGAILLGCTLSTHFPMTHYCDLIAIDDTNWVGVESMIFNIQNGIYNYRDEKNLSKFYK